MRMPGVTMASAFFSCINHNILTTQLVIIDNLPTSLRVKVCQGFIFGPEIQ